jgi:hypothetical protein
MGDFFERIDTYSGSYSFLQSPSFIFGSLLEPSNSFIEPKRSDPKATSQALQYLQYIVCSMYRAALLG